MEDGISLFSRLPSAKQGSEAKQGSAFKSKNQKLNNNERTNAQLSYHRDEATDVNRSNLLNPASTTAVAPSKRTAESLEVDETASFRDLGLTEWLDKVCTSLGMTHPTLVQRGCIPAILQGRDVIGVAHTGSGKTAAFALPILQRLSKDPYGVFALVLTPTRELAFQLADQFRALGAGQTLKESVVIGGLDMQAQTKELARRPHVVIATPGRLRQLLSLDATLAPAFRRASFLVLDEADRLLEPTFESDLASIMQILPEERQTLLFSATMTRTLTELQTALLRDAYHFQAYEGLQTAGPNLKEEYMLIPAKVKEVYLVNLLQSLEERRHVRSAIVFAGTCRGCALLAALLEELNISATALHSGLPQKRRMAALDRFKGGSIPILLATDVASRGLDIPTVDLVINFDLPTLARDYVHRVGRTARAGRKGWSLSFVSQYDVELVQKIEQLTGKQLEKFDLEESEVLKGITQVYAARRAASLRVVDAENKTESGARGGLNTRKNKKNNKKRKAETDGGDE
jgi:ATP-dependent RNA helicase DDX49/DBP8